MPKVAPQKLEVITPKPARWYRGAGWLVVTGLAGLVGLVAVVLERELYAWACVMAAVLGLVGFANRRLP